LETWHVILFAIGLLCLWLLTQRWFWLIVLGIGGLASAFATLASIFHFQILGALGFFFLTAICWFLFSLVVSSYD
jgi:hypothetical protein